MDLDGGSGENLEKDAIGLVYSIDESHNDPNPKPGSGKHEYVGVDRSKSPVLMKEKLQVGKVNEAAQAEIKANYMNVKKIWNLEILLWSTRNYDTFSTTTQIESATFSFLYIGFL